MRKIAIYTFFSIFKMEFRIEIFNSHSFHGHVLRQHVKLCGDWSVELLQRYCIFRVFKWNAKIH